MTKSKKQCTSVKKIPRIYEDTNIIIVNKPAGIAVQGGAKIMVSLIDILEKECSIPIFPVHRLDKETAGLMLFAKNQKTAATYTQLVQTKAIMKEYRALCFNRPQKNNGLITSPIREKGVEKQAHTEYSLLEANELFSYVHLKLGTGRMHQLRIHLASIGCPIVGDDKYGDFKRNKELRSEMRIKKLQLLAYKITLPIDQVPLSFSVPLPLHMQDCITKLFL